MNADPSQPVAVPSTGDGFDPSRTLARLGDALRRLRHRFARRRSAIQTRDGIAVLDGNSTHSRWIVARSLCMYRSEDFANIPRNRREAAVALRIPVWSPFERVGHHCAWSGSTAMVWFWDEAVVQVDPTRLGLPAEDATDSGPPPGIRTLPETVLYPKPADGVQVQACREGFDLQYWRDGVLVDSLWLAERPDAPRLHAFAAQHADVDETDVAGAAAVDAPRISPATFAPDPWVSPFQPRAWLLANERALAVAALTVVAAVAAFQEARFWRYHLAHASDSAEFDRIDQQLDPILEARNELDALNRENAFLARIMNQPSQAEVMVRMDQALPSRATQFRAWRYQQGDLTVVLSDHANRDPVAVIASLQAEKWFADARPGRTAPDGLEVSLRIDPEASRP